MNHFETVREALTLATDGPIVDRDGMMAQALTALTAIEADHYSAADMADAAAQGFRDGVASVQQRQEPIGHLHSNGDFCQTSGLGEVESWPVPLFAAPVAQQPNEWREAVLDWLANIGKDFPIDTPPSEIVKWLMDYERELAQQPQAEAVPSSDLSPDEGDPVTLWEEIWRLREAVKGPDGYATWQDAATAERIRRVRAESKHAAPAPQQQQYDQTALELCAVCGWKTLIPGDCCLNCERNKAQQPQAEPDDEILKERDDAEDFIDMLLDEVLGTDRPEWTSAYGRDDALRDVQERMTALHKPTVDKAWDRFEKAQQPQARPDFSDEWTGYLKDGETPFERFMRERKDLDALTKLYQRALDENERLQGQQPQAEPDWINGVPHWSPALVAKVKQMTAELDEPKQPQAEAVPSDVTDAMVVAGARALCDRFADTGGVSREDQWNIYAEDFKDDARAVLNAAIAQQKGGGA